MSERERITVAVWCEGREYEELAEALGLFGRFLPVSGFLRPLHSFTELLTDTRDMLSAATQWQHYAALDQSSAAHETVGDISYLPYGFMLLDTRVTEQEGPLAPLPRWPSYSRSWLTPARPGSVSLRSPAASRSCTCPAKKKPPRQ